MKQLDNVELFVCSEDDTSAIGFADKAEVWTEGGGTTLILRGINATTDDLLRAENECLRRDVEFYKKLWQARGGGGAEPIRRQPEVDESEFIHALEDYAEGRISHIDVAKTAEIALVKSEPTEVERLAALIAGHVDPGGVTPGSLAEYLIAHGVKENTK